MNIRAALIALIAGVASINVFAADIIVTKSIIHTGEVVRVESNGTVHIKVAIGEFPIPASDIIRADVAKPAALDAALAAAKANKFLDALNALRPVAEKYTGLQVAWMPDVLVKLGEACIATRDYPGAQK